MVLPTEQQLRDFIDLNRDRLRSMNTDAITLFHEGVVVEMQATDPFSSSVQQTLRLAGLHLQVIAIKLNEPDFRYKPILTI